MLVEARIAGGKLAASEGRRTLRSSLLSQPLKPGGPCTAPGDYRGVALFRAASTGATTRCAARHARSPCNYEVLAPTQGRESPGKTCSLQETFGKAAKS